MIVGDVDDWRDVVHMYAMHRRWSKAHPDLADFHRRRYEAYRDLLGVDLAQPPSTAADHRYLHHLLMGFADAFSGLHSPFAGYLEAPEAIVDVYAVHGRPIQALFDDLERRYLDLMVDCAVRLWGPCPHRVTNAELAARGVGREHEPDYLDYF
jgi:hypothetical protein